uniref:Monodehydroascorbate reductase n=1 Tax=Tanacetum cinerariifolium TaxID=118510 RepID=A0A6L2MMQ2_TANCI|nr:monodehydroascorbate reductase [Tanacetum cinerariifolium]
MSSITAQQAKLDLELVPKEKRLEIRKCNERLNPGKIQREPTFKVVLDALALTPCYSTFLITAYVLEVYMHQFWDSIYKHDTFYIFKMDKSKRFKLNLEIFRDIFKICPAVQSQDFDALPTDEEIVTFLRELGHTREINSLNDVVVDHMHQPWRTFTALINKSLSEKTTGLDKLRLSRAQILWGKPASPKLTTVLISTEAPTKKSKRVKRPAKKSAQTPARGVVIRETLEMPLTKKKEKLDVTRGNDEDDINNEQVSSDEDGDHEKDSNNDKTQSDNKHDLNLEHQTDESELGSEYDHDKSKENDEDDGDEDETKITDKVEGDEDEEVNFTTSQPHDVDIRLNEPVDTDEGFVQYEGTDAAMTNIQQGNENPEILQVIKDAHVTHSTIPQKTKVPVTSFSHSSDLGKFLNFSNIPYSDPEMVSPMDVHIQHEVPNQQTPTLLTVHVSVISDSSQVFSTVIPQSLQSFTPPPQQSTSTPLPTTEATNPLSTLIDFTSVFQFNNRVTTLEKEVAELREDDPLKTQVTALVDEHLDARLRATRDEFMNFLSASITARITKQAVLAKESSQPQSLYEAAATLTEFELKKILIDKIDKKPAKGPKAKESQSSSSKGDKSKSKSSRNFVQSEEPEFEVADSDMPRDQEENPDNDDEPKENVASKRDCLNINNLTQETLLGPAFRILKEGDDYPFDLTKPLPLVKIGNHQKAWFQTFRVLLKSPMINMHFEESHIERNNVDVMKKHGYGYMQEILVRRSDNELYRFKEGDFPRLRINDIEDMLLLVVRNRLTNLSGNDVLDFTIALRMFTRSLVIQKNRDPYTPYQDPQGFIYVDDNERNRLMRSDELYKFSDGTLTRLRTSLSDITKNIRIEYLPKRR